MYQVHRESHYFNPRSDERSDCIQKVSGYKGIIFQSTLRRTERHFKFCSSWKSIYFNPRSDERSDYFLWFYTQYNCLFQSTLRRTERLTGNQKLVFIQTFQSTLRRTERLTGNQKLVFIQTFQSTLRRTERLQAVSMNPTSQSISIHAPTNGATYADIVA